MFEDIISIVCVFFFQRNMLNWIKDPSILYDLAKNEFNFDKSSKEVTIQSPQPLTKGILYYICMRECSGLVVECMTGDPGAAGSSLIGVTALCP